MDGINLIYPFNTTVKMTTTTYNWLELPLDYSVFLFSESMFKDVISYTYTAKVVASVNTETEEFLGDAVKFVN